MSRVGKKEPHRTAGTAYTLLISDNPNLKTVEPVETLLLSLDNFDLGVLSSQ